MSLGEDDPVLILLTVEVAPIMMLYLPKGLSGQDSNHNSLRQHHRLQVSVN